jgi:kynurenine formamidase
MRLSLYIKKEPMRVVDLSHTVEPGMPTYPGTPGPAIQPLASIAEQGYAEQLVTFSTHTGTHVDLPSHIIPDKVLPDVFTVEQFAGSGIALDVRGSTGELISVDMLMPYSALIKECDFLLLCSGWSSYWGTPDYFERYPVLTIDAARWLAGFRLKGLGVDMISVDEADSADFPVHKILLQKGIVLIENLAGLSSLLHENFIFCCFPLKLAAAEASPVRAVALFD